MARSDFESMIAPKPVVRRIEQYKRARGLPSRSQALSAIIEEVEKDEQIKNLLTSFYDLLKDLATELAKQGNDKASQLIIKVLDAMLQLLKSASIAFRTSTSL